MQRVARRDDVYQDLCNYWGKSREPGGSFRDDSVPWMEFDWQWTASRGKKEQGGRIHRGQNGSLRKGIAQLPCRLSVMDAIPMSDRRKIALRGQPVDRRRSLTAEKLCEGLPAYQARSAGTQPDARIALTTGHIGWADTIFVMEVIFTASGENSPKPSPGNK